MRSIEINLARRPFRNDAPVVTGLALLIAVTLGLTGYNAYTYFTADSRLEQLDEQLADHQRRMEEYQSEAQKLRSELKKVDMATLEPQAQFVNGVLRERNFSWTRLFNAFEQVLPWNVRLIAVRPSFEGADVMIEVSAVARDHEAYLGLQTALHDSPLFDKVIPGGFEAEQGGTSRVFFDMTFRYRPSAFAELDAAEEAADRSADGTEAPGEEPTKPEAEASEDPPAAETADRRLAGGPTGGAS